MAIGEIKVDLKDYIKDIKIDLCDNCTNLTSQCESREAQEITVDETGITSKNADCENFRFKERTEMIQKCKNLIYEIEEKFKPFTKIFWEEHKGNIIKDEMLNQMRSIVAEMSDETMEEFNVMASMLSECNCGWDDYKTGSIIHNLLIEKWYPEGC